MVWAPTNTQDSSRGILLDRGSRINVYAGEWYHGMLSCLVLQFADSFFRRFIEQQFIFRSVQMIMSVNCNKHKASSYYASSKHRALSIRASGSKFRSFGAYEEKLLTAEPKRVTQNHFTTTLYDRVPSLVHGP